MRSFLTNFFINILTRLTPYWVLCLCFFSLITLVCMVAYLLIHNLASDQLTLNNELHLLAYQLTILTLSSTIIFSIGLRIYFYYRNKSNNSLTAFRLQPIETGNTSTDPAINQQEKNTAQKQTPKHIHQDLFQLLIVDDNEANLMVLKNYLNASNNTIFTASNGLDALTLFERECIDIILMDLEMDGMDGVQTLEHIRALEKTSPVEQQQRVPVIAVSAHSRETMQFKALQQGFDDYLAKPVSQQDVIDTLRRWKPVASRITEGREKIPLSASTHGNKFVSPDVTSSVKLATKPLITHPFPQNLKTVISKQEDNLKKVVNIELSLVHSNRNNQLAKDMLQMLITMIDTEKDRLHFFYNEKDWEKLYQLNHKIYGGSSYCGVPELQRANKKLEMLLQRQLAFHEPKESLITEDEHTKTDDIDCAIKGVNAAIDNILRWNKEHDIDVIFNL
jgi:CheY-like chemotaxis protein